MKVLVLDDMEIRHTVFQTYHDNIVSVYTVEEFEEALKKDEYVQIFLDHDLGPGSNGKNGRDAVEVIGRVLKPDPKLEVVVHSSNSYAGGLMVNRLWELGFTSAYYKDFLNLMTNMRFESREQDE